MRNASVSLGSLAGMCTNPVYGSEAKTLPPNSFSHGMAFISSSSKSANSLQAWSIGRSIAISRSLKQDPITTLLAEQNGVLLFTGKITSVTRTVTKGFTRGNVTLETIASDGGAKSTGILFVEFENENLSAVLKVRGAEDSVLAVCPDLIQVSPSLVETVREWILMSLF